MYYELKRYGVKEIDIFVPIIIVMLNLDHTLYLID